MQKKYRVLILSFIGIFGIVWTILLIDMIVKNLKYGYSFLDFNRFDTTISLLIVVLFIPSFIFHLSLIKLDKVKVGKTKLPLDSSVTNKYLFVGNIFFGSVTLIQAIMVFKITLGRHLSGQNFIYHNYLFSVFLACISIVILYDAAKQKHAFYNIS